MTAKLSEITKIAKNLGLGQVNYFEFRRIEANSEPCRISKIERV